MGFSYGNFNMKSNECICPECNKFFIATPEWVYKEYGKKQAGAKVNFCSWSCLKKWRARREDKRRRSKAANE